MRPILPLLLVAPLLLGACGRALEDGLYRFEAGELVQDSCGPEAGDVALPDAELRIAGDTVAVEFRDEGALPGVTGAAGERALLGRFLPDRDEERFIADATFDVAREIGGLSCIAFAHTSLDAIVESGRSFAGTIRVQYTSRPEAQPGCPRACVIDVAFSARRVD